ncbi:hypothetical protein ACROYT_G011199 [Oculina patagonica]
MSHYRNESGNLSNWHSWSNVSLEGTSPSLFEITGSSNTEDSLPVEIVKLAMYATCALFGIIGNALVIAVLIRLRGKKTRATDFYLINLAIADLGSLLLVFPMGATRERVPLNWPFGEFVCLYVQPFTEVFLGASIWCIAITAIDRYLKIAKLHVKQQASLKRAGIVAACTWLVSFLVFSLPLYFVLGYRKLPGGGIYCGPEWPSWDYDFVLPRVYVALIVVLSYILPLSVISWTFLAVSKKLSESSKFITTMNHEKGSKTASLTHNRPFARRKHAIRLMQNRRAKRILTPVVLVFAFFMLPLALLRLCAVFWPPIAVQTFYNNLFYVVVLCAIINSSANPVIYSLVRRDFRRQLARIVCGNNKRKSQPYSLSKAFSSIELGLYRFPPSQRKNCVG